MSAERDGSGLSTFPTFDEAYVAVYRENHAGQAPGMDVCASCRRQAVDLTRGDESADG